MNRLTKLAFCLYLAAATSAVAPAAFAATIDERISARLDALERENAALRTRVIRLEASKAAKTVHQPNPALAGVARPQYSDTVAVNVGARRPHAPRFEVSG